MICRWGNTEALTRIPQKELNRRDISWFFAACKIATWKSTALAEQGCGSRLHCEEHQEEAAPR